MYRIDRDVNRLNSLTPTTFAELGFKERQHLQEWIAADPSVLGEDLLIIQKEFAGFDDTNERLDLLALDKQGNLVIIENKLDDSGRDVTWQALKYASYCSNLAKNDIRDIFQTYLNAQPGEHLNAEEELAAFVENGDYEDLELNQGVTQRINLVAGHFRKEVTSTVIWLRNFQVQIDCFRVKPYVDGNATYVNIERIIPLHEAEEYMIGMAKKSRDDLATLVGQRDKDQLRLEFWRAFLQEASEQGSMFANITPGPRAWIHTGSGIGGVHFAVVITDQLCMAELYIGRSNKEENKWLFDHLRERRENLEAAFSERLIWQRLDQKKACRIKTEIAGSLVDRDHWPKMIQYLVDRSARFEMTFTEPLQALGATMRQQDPGRNLETPPEQGDPNR